MAISTSKLNESFYRIKGELHELQPIMNRLHVERPGAYFEPMVKRGLKASYDKFYNVQDGDLIIPSGLITFLGEYGVQHVQKTPEYTAEEILEFIKSKPLPFEPYDYQIRAVIESILNYQQISLAATGSGKSVILSLIADFFRTKDKKGLILVPSISLTTQLQGDIKDYNLHDLYNETKLIGGENTDKILNTQLTISTWQSMQKIKDNGESGRLLRETENEQLDKFEILSVNKKKGKYKKITYDDGTYEIIPL